eukprot:6473170-Amphidinium_carterae.1
MKLCYRSAPAVGGNPFSTKASQCSTSLHTCAFPARGQRNIAASPLQHVAPPFKHYEMLMAWAHHWHQPSICPNMQEQGDYMQLASAIL